VRIHIETDSSKLLSRRGRCGPRLQCRFYLIEKGIHVFHIITWPRRSLDRQIAEVGTAGRRVLERLLQNLDKFGFGVAGCLELDIPYVFCCQWRLSQPKERLANSIQKIIHLLFIITWEQVGRVELSLLYPFGHFDRARSRSR
jgi:hypothetical protein